MILHINETGQCWVCGRDTEEITSHHALPKHLKPVNNIIIPICEGCHKRINLEDINGMFAYLFKIKKTMQEQNVGINKAIKDLYGLKKIKESQMHQKANEVKE